MTNNFLQITQIQAKHDMSDKLQNAKNLDAAAANYDRAVPLEPPYAASYIERGNALKELNRLDDAIANYKKAISLKDDYAEAYNNLGVALSELKRHMEAFAYFDKAIRLKPDLWQAHHNRDLAIADRLRLAYKARFGVWPRLNPPISFNEHILHRTIYDRDPRLRIVCDKLAVRRLIARASGRRICCSALGGLGVSKGNHLAHLAPEICPETQPLSRTRCDRRSIYWSK